MAASPPPMLNGGDKEAKRIEDMALALSTRAPPWAATYIQKLAPILGVLGAGMEVVLPGIWHFYTVLYGWYTHLPKNLASVCYGVGICFFGGRYAVSIAAVEAFRSAGGSSMLSDVKEIAQELQAANREDEQRDDDGDGTADASQLDGGSLVARKCALVLRTVDPARLQRTMESLWSGYMGVLLVLKYKFAKTVALAHSIGDTMRPAAAKLAAPTILAVTPPEYRKWVNPSINFGCKLTAMILAWRIQMVISTVQSGIQGGLLASQSLLAFLNERKMVSLRADSSLVDEVAGWSLAAAGIYYQLVKGGPVPLVLAPVLWPMGVLDRILQWSVTWVDTKA